MCSLSMLSNDKTILQFFFDKTKCYFNFCNHEKKCIYCNNTIPYQSPRCISCWLNDEKYFVLIEKILYTEKKIYFEKICDKLKDTRNEYINIHFKCQCDLPSNTIIKNGTQYSVCPLKKCDFFKNNPKHYIQEIDNLLCKIQNVDFNTENNTRFPFSKSQKESIIIIYNCFFQLLNNIENKKRETFDNFFRLDGFAGTGKTSVIQSLFNLPELRGFNICCCSNTHAAVEVSRDIHHKEIKNKHKNNLCIIDDIAEIYNLIEENILDYSFLSFIVKDNNYETISSLLKEKPKYNHDGSITFNDNTIQTIKKIDVKNKSIYNIRKYDILIVDEYSMMTEDKVEWFKTFSEYLNTFVIFVGDKEQIPPQILIKNENDLNTKLLSINMKNVNLKEIHRTQGDVTILSNLIRQSKNIKEIRDNIQKFSSSNEIKIVNGPLNINNFNLMYPNFKDEPNIDNQPKLLAYSNNRVHQINEICHKDIPNFDKMITYKPIKIYGEDNISKQKYEIYLNINTNLEILKKSKNVNISDVINNIKWEDIIEKSLHKIDESKEDKIKELYIKINKNDTLLKLILKSQNIKDIIELENIRNNEYQNFKNIYHITEEIKILDKIKHYIINNISTNEQEFLCIQKNKKLTSNFTEIKSIFENFIMKSTKNMYTCLETFIDGGKNIQFKIKINDTRNIIKKTYNTNMKDIIKDNPFKIYIVKNEKEIANICNTKKKIKIKMDEINQIIDNYHIIYKKTFLLIQEIIWELIHKTFDNLLLFSNNNKNLQKYFNISEDVYVSHPFASTIHKSQGQTFSDVYVDVHNIINNNQHFIVKKRLLYTAITRCSGKLYLNIGY